MVSKSQNHGQETSVSVAFVKSVALRISRHHGIIKDPQAEIKNNTFKILQVISFHGV